LLAALAAAKVPEPMICVQPVPSLSGTEYSAHDPFGGSKPVSYCQTLLKASPIATCSSRASSAPVSFSHSRMPVTPAAV
jgi:hypothetical protein